MWGEDKAEIDVEVAGEVVASKGFSALSAMPVLLQFPRKYNVRALFTFLLHFNFIYSLFSFN